MMSRKNPEHRLPGRCRLAARLGVLAAALLLFPAWSPAAQPEIRVAVVGGIQLCGVWPILAKRAGEVLGMSVVTVSAAPKEVVGPVFERGEADLLLIHASDHTSALLANGMAAPLRAWAQNEHVIVGPPGDPAAVRGAADAVEAMRRIAAAGAPFIAFRNPGSHSLVQELWHSAGISPGPWVLQDTTTTPRAILALAAEKQAYGLVGHIPVAFGKIPGAGMAVLLAGDPATRRLYVAVEPGPRHPATPERRAAARRLADYLLSPTGQRELAIADRQAGGPWIYPLPAPKP